MSTRILLVDDDDMLRPMFRRALELSGYDVVEASNGREALARYREQRPALVVTDMVMPGCEGLELIRELRKIADNVPILAMSGGGRSRPDDYLRLAMGFGASSTIAKPFSGDDLIAAIEMVIGSRPEPA
jgi:DNA-binding response OmpR family regulator